MPARCFKMDGGGNVGGQIVRQGLATRDGRMSSLDIRTSLAVGTYELAWVSFLLLAGTAFGFSLIWLNKQVKIRR